MTTAAETADLVEKNRIECIKKLFRIHLTCPVAWIDAINYANMEESKEAIDRIEAMINTELEQIFNCSLRSIIKASLYTVISESRVEKITILTEILDTLSTCRNKLKEEKWQSYICANGFEIVVGEETVSAGYAIIDAMNRLGAILEAMQKIGITPEQCTQIFVAGLDIHKDQNPDTLLKKIQINSTP